VKGLFKKLPQASSLSVQCQWGWRCRFRG